MSTLRAIQAAERRRQREAQRQLRELESQAREQAKLSAIEQARLEVENYESRVELLRSVHKEQGEVWDWPAIAASLPPPRPQKTSYHQQRASQQFTVLPAAKKEAAQFMLEQARVQDEQDFQTSIKGGPPHQHLDGLEGSSGKLGMPLRGGPSRSFSGAKRKLPRFGPP
ncbi:MAG: hypothetical protein ABSF38_01385 [Verrucomicrobiota bacterium]|jgi:hypothetical protein